MDIPKINFLNNLFDKKEQSKKKIVPRLLFYPLIFLLLFVAFFSFQVILSGESIMETIEKVNIFNNIGLSLSKDKLLKGEAEDRINILLLGMGGEGHPGPYLTDTIMIVSLKPSTGQVAMVSVPRDLSVPIPGYGWRKINNANHYGEMDKPGQGAEFAASVISDVFDLPIHYYARVDFSGFANLIDELGGIDVNVENGFVDYQFPTDDYGYQTVSFTQGRQKMDGETALNYARSRHGTNGENSDFARSRRQQKVLQAVKDEALSFSTFLSLKKISALYDLYKDNINTDLEIWEMYKFAKLAKDIDSKNITNIVLDNGNDGPLYSTNINGAYLLLPKDMSFYQVQQIVRYAFDPETEIKVKEQVKVEIQNGTKINGLAYKTSIALKNEGFKVVKIGNAEEQNYDTTLIYDFTDGQLTDELNKLKNQINAQSQTEIPETITDSINSNIDFLIILGQDQQSLSQID